MSTVVLITGVSRPLGARLAARLAADPGVERVIGVDTFPPHPDELARFGRAEFVRADIGHRLIATVLRQARVDTLVHPSGGVTSRTAPQGVHAARVSPAATRNLLAAARECTTLRRVVAASSTAVYDAGPHQPSVVAEATRPAGDPPRGPVRDAGDTEALLRGFARARGDVGVTVLRLAAVVGPTVSSWLTRYLSLPAVPVGWGYDPRVQVLHEDDAVAVLGAAVTDAGDGPRSTVLNVAGAGAMPLSQALRRGGRPRLPLLVPGAAVPVVAGLAGALAGYDDAAEWLRFGRVVDTDALERRYGPVVRRTTAETLDEFFAALPRVPHAASLAAGALGLGEQLLREQAARGAIGAGLRATAAAVAAVTDTARPT